MASIIEAPVKDFNGSVGGVQFANGKAETDNPAVIAYCRAAGYEVSESEKVPVEYKQGDEPPAGNASTDEWKAWAVAQGKTDEELAGLGRGEIRALLIPAE
ncbi:hypothetical protein [Glutamicibacter sp. NPDC087344]|uniref:hypothetical protein n=1 Tax=Glutamicibacter sp. NPDC087344 TaxID=3363994 RepID=UPI0037F3BAD0